MDRPNWHVVEQRTQAWDDLRRGKATGSVISTILASGRNGEESKTRQKLLVKLATELDTGLTLKDHFETQAMRDGTEREAAGTALFEQITGEMVDTSYGFIDHPTIPRFGVSPDGILLPASFSGYPTDGFELKSPELHTFTERVLSRKVPMGYTWQCQALMECAALERVHFANFHPDRPQGQRLLVIVVERNEMMIDTMRRGVKLFNEEVEEYRYALSKARYL